MGLLQYLNINISSDDDLPLEKSLEIYNNIILVILVINDENRLYPQIYLEECFKN